MLRGVLLLVVLTIESCLSHICLLQPPQRGPLDISQSGSPTCFRHGPPCGGQPSMKPTVLYHGGQQLFIKFQQNYNHYEPGFPGYMGISLASADKMDDLTSLAIIGDENFHIQDHVRNYTILVILPNINCPHCVLQLLYQSHKPGEETFYQCADVQIKKSQNINPDGNLHVPLEMSNSEKQASRLHEESKQHFQSKKYMSMLSTAALYGLSFNPFMSNRCQYVSVDLVTGAIKKLSTLPVGVSDGFQPPKAYTNKFSHDTTASMPAFLLAPVAVHDVDRNVTIFIKHSANTSLDDVAHQMYMVGTFNGTMVKDTPIVFWDGTRIEFLDIIGDSNYIMTQMAVGEDAIKLQATWLMFDSETVHKSSIHLEQPYVNFLWASTNYFYDKGDMYVLIGNENAPDLSDTRLYVLNISPTSETKYVQLDCSKYTITSLLVYKKTGQLLALSPGVYGDKYPAWSLVEIDPNTGSITQLVQATPAGVFENYYGGTILNGIDQSMGVYYHVLRIADAGSDVILHIEIGTGRVTFSQPANLGGLHNLLFARPEVFI